MNDVRIVHEFPCDEDTFWQRCFFDEEYNRKLYLGALAFSEWRIAKQDDRGDTYVRSIETSPKLENVPGPMKKIIGDRLSYLENGTFDRKEKRYRFHIVPSTMPDKTRIDGAMYCERVGEGRIRRVVEVHVEVKIFAIGGMIEDKIAADLRSNYDKAATFTKTWLADKKL
jgi:hypothetical protein